jgi:hypothetical protein
LQGNLHLGERGHRHFGHQVIEDAVAPKITVRQDVIADRLRASQTSAMTDHQPAMRPQYREVVGDVLGIRGAEIRIPLVRSADGI